jgi:RNA polymerase sigma-70 factor (ECF subfamily)
MGEAELISGAAAQTRAQTLPDFDTLYDAMFPLVWRTLQRLGVPRAQLDDAAQEVFTAAHRRLHALEGPETCSWLVGLSVCAAADVRRALRRKGEHVALDDGLSDAGPDPLDATMRRQARSLVDALLLGIDDAQREVFVLAEMEGLTGPEIGEALQVKLNTVRSRLRLARVAFESRLRAFPGTDARELLAAARGAYDPLHGDRVRVRAALAVALRAAGTAGGASGVLMAVVFAASVAVGSLGVLGGADMVRTSSSRPTKVAAAPAIAAHPPVRAATATGQR